MWADLTLQVPTKNLCITHAARSNLRPDCGGSLSMAQPRAASLQLHHRSPSRARTVSSAGDVEYLRARSNGGPAATARQLCPTCVQSGGSGVTVVDCKEVGADDQS